MYVLLTGHCVHEEYNLANLVHSDIGGTFRKNVNYINEENNIQPEVKKVWYKKSATLEIFWQPVGCMSNYETGKLCKNINLKTIQNCTNCETKT